MWNYNYKYSNTFTLSYIHKKIHVQVHFTIASEFYVHLNVKLYMHDYIVLYG